MKTFLVWDGKNIIREGKVYANIMLFPQVLSNTIVTTNQGWQFREIEKCLNNPLPNFFPVQPQHYTHLSEKQKGKLAFTKSAVHGFSDRQTIIKPGRYLAEFFPHIKEKERTHITERFNRALAPIVLKFESTREGIRRVYENGPNSCMNPATGHDKPIVGGIHAVEAYAAGDLAVAYLQHESDNIKVLARTIVWPDKKIMSPSPDHFYPRESELRLKLAQELACLGYSPGSFNGAKMLKIEHKNGFIMPYLDGVRTVSDTGSHFEIGVKGSYYNCDRIDGIIGRKEEEERSTCGHCEEPSCYAAYYDCYDGVLCDSCAGEIIFSCRICDDYHMVEDMCTASDCNYTYCSECFNERASNCDNCESDFIYNISYYDGASKTYCEDCAEELINKCSVCEDYYEKDDIFYRYKEDELVCNDCFDIEGHTNTMAELMIQPLIQALMGGYDDFF